MRFLVVTHVVHKASAEGYWGYEPYVREMNLWFKQVDEVVIVAPLSDENPQAIDAIYDCNKLQFIKVPAFGFNGVGNTCKSLFLIPSIFVKLLVEMRAADHIHLRCPGNMGLLGCVAQVFSPHKPKTAKYAGNWDPKAKQPWSYRLQKWLLSNEFLTRKMKVLVYGEWPGQTKNIKPFFTASYAENKKVQRILPSFESPYRFLYVGTLSKGKNPLYAVQLVEALNNKGISCFLDIYGEGSEMEVLIRYANENGLSEIVILHGNQNTGIVEAAYKESQFLILPSRSEGWPKVVAEAMFWGVIPIATSVSCVPWMLGFGERGLILTMDLEKDATHIFNAIANKMMLEEIAIKAQAWSQEYTLEKFENEIKKLL